ncbi:hypothetical protein BKA66DRAFT_571848 [Pyrenochaeta sp. MPI-SDFR-AT-0127]|nr:hypothetical protein BKA66DRAFT_571848 [Pyrenochaeta sp. MPI-SDFR-AT-0127]
MVNTTFLTFILGFASMGIALTTQDISAETGVSVTDVSELLSTVDTSSIDIKKWVGPLNVTEETVTSWPVFVKSYVLDEMKATFQEGLDIPLDEATKPKLKSIVPRQNNRERVEAQINRVLIDARSRHDDTHRRQLAGCRSFRCGLCATGISVAWAAALGACGAAAATEEAISAGTLTPIAAVQLTACVAGAHGLYLAGWSECLGM